MSAWKKFNKEVVNKAAKATLKYLDPVMLHFFENCVSCAVCETACPYYAVGEEYSPVNKAETLRKIYRTEVNILPKIFPWLFNAGLPKNTEELNRWSELAYRCTNCGLCYVTCPFGIHSGEMIKVIRGFLYKTGRVPSILKAMIDMETSGMFLKIQGFIDLWNDVLEKAKKEGGEISFDKEGAEYLYLPSLAEAMIIPESIIATVRVLNKLGIDWTMPKDPLSIRVPVGALAGDGDSASKIVKRIYDYIKKIGPKYLVFSDGGYPYTVFRFDLPGIVGEKPSFKTLHIVELVLEKIDKLNIERGDDKITWHSPCKMGRFGGLIEEPALLLSKLSSGFRKLKSHGLFSKCCGGGNAIACVTFETMEMIGKLSGMQMQISEEEKSFIDKLERDMFVASKAKIDEIKESGADTVYTACVGCIHTLKMATKRYGLKVNIKHISEIIADRIK